MNEVDPDSGQVCLRPDGMLTFGGKLGTCQAVVSAMERGKADSRIRAFLDKIEFLEQNQN